MNAQRQIQDNNELIRKLTNSNLPYPVKQGRINKLKRRNATLETLIKK